MTVLPAKHPKPTRDDREDHLIKGDVNVERLVLDALAKGIKGIRIEDSITTGEINRTIEGASTVTMTVHDAGREILRSGRLESETGRLSVIDLKLDGLWFRLQQIQKSGDDLNLTFEDRQVARLRLHKGPRKAGDRAKVTRAQYILQLVRSVKEERIKTRIHELKVKQPIKGFPADERRSKRERRAKDDDERRPGFAPGAGRRLNLNPAQMNRIETCLNVAERIGVSEKVATAMLVAMAGESGFGSNTGSRGTTFQTLEIPESQIATQAYHFLKGGRSFLAGGAIGYDREHPSASPGEIASQVEISDAGAAHYDKYRGKARAILEEWGGQTGGTTFRVKRYTFKVDKGESYWDAIQRLAKDVGWRAFVTGGKFYYISEEDLMRSRPRFEVDEDDDAIIAPIDFDWDHRKKTGKLTVPCRLNRWSAPPGTVVIVKALGPANGRWLVESVRRSMYSSDGTIVLKRPMKERPEPAPEREEVTGEGEGFTGEGGGDVQELMDICRKFHGGYSYGGGHGPKLSSLSVNQGLDCSSSCSLALFMAGLFRADVAMVSGQFASSYGEPGRGKEFTVYAHSGHVYIQFEGPNKEFRFDTSPHSGDQPSSSGPRLRQGSRSSAGFTARHFPGH